jgi:hypothetical protein
MQMVESVQLSQLRRLVLIGHCPKPPAKRDPRVIQSALEAPREAYSRCGRKAAGAAP